MDNRFRVSTYRFHTLDSNKLLVIGFFETGDVGESRLIIKLDKQELSYTFEEIKRLEGGSFFRMRDDITKDYFVWIELPEHWKKARQLQIYVVNQSENKRVFRLSVLKLKRVEKRFPKFIDTSSVREDGFTIYKGKTKPEEVKTVTFESEIVSSFASGDYLGFVFLSGASEHPFSMKLYKTNGSLQMEKSFDLIYDEIKISGNHIIINNTSELRIFSLKGIERYAGHIEEGNIAEVVKTGMNRYLVAYNGGVMSIRLK